MSEDTNECLSSRTLGDALARAEQLRHGNSSGPPLTADQWDLIQLADEVLRLREHVRLVFKAMMGATVVPVDD